MNIHSLYLYPVKSLAGVAVESFALDDFGPVGDRRWMIVDASQRFVSQRSHPELACVSTRFEGQDVVISIPGEDDFILVPGAGRQQVGVWKDQVQAVSGPDRASAALSRYCGESLCLVYMSDHVFRRVDPDWVPAYRRVSFSDGFPFLVTNQASLQELNSRLEHPVGMDRFRPNIVISGAGPWEEDGWSTLDFQNVSLSLVKPCSRCILTTVDPRTGVRSPEGQPLKTLATYRRTPDGVIFGANGVHLSEGTLAVGDPVTAF